MTSRTSPARSRLTSPRPEPHRTCRTAVVVMTRNRRESLARTLRHLSALPERPPILVVDNGSTDGTPALVRTRFPHVRLTPLASNVGPAARTLGAEAAPTPYVAFSDDDSWWRPGALARAAELFDAHPSVAVVAARTLVGAEEREDEVNEEMRASPLGREPELPGPSVLGFLACAAVVRRSAFLEVGGFRESIISGEESLLAVDLAGGGWRSVYAEDVVAHHHPSPIRDPARRRRGEARNVLVFAWLRRPLRTALPRTLRVLRAALTDLATLRGALDAVRAAPRLAREREVVRPDLERALRRLGL